MDEQNENKLSLKETIKLWAWGIYLGGVIIQTFYGYFFHPLLKHQSFAYNFAKGLLWFTIIPVLREILGLLVLGVVFIFLYSDKFERRDRDRDN